MKYARLIFVFVIFVLSSYEHGQKMPQRQRRERQLRREHMRNVRQRVDIPIALRKDENPEPFFLEINPKRYLKLEEYNWERLPITLDVSRRITHQITSHVLKIFLEEQLGYPDIILRERNDPWDQPYAARDRLTPEFDELDRLKNSPPETTLNTEVWISPEDDLLLWADHNNVYVKQAGPIGPPARYGWFIPHILLNNRNVPTYWKTFTSSDLVQQFALTDAEMDLIKNYMNYNDSGYYCEEDFCNKGVHTPPQCVTQTCAMLIASYADSEEFVVKHIDKMQLLVQVVWVGPHLAHVVDTLTQMLASTTRSLVFLSLKPSEVVLPDDKTFASVMFPPCGDNDLDRDIGCRYDLHSLVKLYTSMFEKAARPAYEAYMKIQFDSSHYRDLLLRYRAALATSRNSTEAVATAACGWLQYNEQEQYVWLGNDDDYSDLYIGGIFPMNPIRGVGAYYDAESIVIAAQLAQQAVNTNDSVLRDYRLKLWVDDGRCEANFVLRSFIDHIKLNKYSKMVGILGPACSNTLESLAGVSHFYRTIVISYSAEGSSFSDRKKYPYFFRTIGENTQYQQVYLQLLAKLNWKRLAALTEDGQKYTEYLSLLQDLLTSKNYTFVINRKFPTVREKYAMKSYLEEMKSKSVRIIIGDVYDDAAREMMCQAYQLQMTAYHSYVWFLPSWLAPDWYDTDRYNKRLDTDNRVPCTTRQMIEAINGHLSLSHASWASDSALMQTNETVGEWRARLNSEIKKRTNRMSVSGYAGYAYDAVWMYALALDQLSKEDPSALSAIHDPKTTKRYVEILEKTDFNGVSGRIQFRGNPSRISVIQVIQWINNVSQIVGIFEPNISTSNKDPMAGTLNLNESMIVWLNPEKTRPKDGTVRCFMGLAEYFGVVDCTLFLAIVNIFGFCILGGLLIIGFLIVKSRYDKEVQLTQQYMNSIGLDLLNVGTLEKWEIPREKVVINRKLGEGAFGFVYGGEAHFNSQGWVAVAVKTLKVGSTTEEKLEFLCEAECMKRFEHKNIVKLLGVCTKNEPTYTVMEFMLYGDLKTFLLARRHLVNEKLGEESDEISSKKLTTMALDVARALGYLAELKFVHRDVASRNCLVNAARVVKLGDFGMTRPMFDKKDYYKFSRKGMLPVRWMSPESLSLGLFTPASDVWSYGVLLYEIITFGSFPFQGMNNNQVLEHVKAGNTLPIPTGVKPQAEALIRSCWTLDYKKRPKASEIVEFIANNPRLLHPCLDVPLASVQIDDSGSVDLLNPNTTRKFSFSLRTRKSSSGIFNTPPPWGTTPNGSFSSTQNGGFTPSLWAQEDTEADGLGSGLFPVGEEDHSPLMNSPDKYVLVQASSNKFSDFDTSQHDSLLCS